MSGSDQSSGYISEQTRHCLTDLFFISLLTVMNSRYPSRITAAASITKYHTLIWRILPKHIYDRSSEKQDEILPCTSEMIRGNTHMNTGNAKDKNSYIKDPEHLMTLIFPAYNDFQYYDRGTKNIIKNIVSVPCPCCRNIQNHRCKMENNHVFKQILSYICKHLSDPPSVGAAIQLLINLSFLLTGFFSPLLPLADPRKSLNTDIFIQQLQRFRPR